MEMAIKDTKELKCATGGAENVNKMRKVQARKRLEEET